MACKKRLKWGSRVSSEISLRLMTLQSLKVMMVTPRWVWLRWGLFRAWEMTGNGFGRCWAWECREKKVIRRCHMGKHTFKRVRAPWSPPQRLFTMNSHISWNQSRFQSQKGPHITSDTDPTKISHWTNQNPPQNHSKMSKNEKFIQQLHPTQLT